MRDSELCAAESTSSPSSSSTRLKSPPESGLKQTAADPAERRPSSVSSVTCAVESAKTRSPEASFSRLRPKRMSPSPMSRPWL
ncbi:MAG: hypothetical protein H0V40_04085 [Actinobacteria bacterium]|nr:hypothetical protein [Actinomycetota bacterium]